MGLQSSIFGNHSSLQVSACDRVVLQNEVLPGPTRSLVFSPRRQRMNNHNSNNPPNEAQRRLVNSLCEALGESIVSALEDDKVVEIMLNPDGRLFIERVGHGMQQTGKLRTDKAESIIGRVAHALSTEVDRERPIISGELPLGGHRFEGLLPPAVPAPTFTIRKQASMLFSLEQYVAQGVISAQDIATIQDAIRKRKNILIVGGTGSGKTTLTNAILAETVKLSPDHRIVILEDTHEIQCAADNHVVLHTTDAVDMAALLKSTMRLRPDRIVVGEVRDGAALTLLKAWNTGHPGGIATIHANSAKGGLSRLEQLVMEVSQHPMRETIGQAIDLIIYIERAPAGRKVREILSVDGFVDGKYLTHQSSILQAVS